MKNRRMILCALTLSLVLGTVFNPPVLEFAQLIVPYPNKKRSCRSLPSRHERFSCGCKVFAFDLLGHGGEGPSGALLTVQLFSGLLAELFTGDKSRHGVHILSSMLLGM